MSCRRKPLGSNHGSASALVHVVAGPRALLGVGGERAVVHAQPRVLVLADDERPQREPVGRRRDLGFDRERTAHLEQLPLLAQAVLRGDRALGGAGVVRPPVHDPTAVRLGHGERGPTTCRERLASAARRPARGRPRRSRCRCRARRVRRARSRPPSSRALTISRSRRRLAGRCRSTPRPEAKGSIPSSAMGRPRTPKGRALETERRLAEEYPDAVCALDFDNPFELLAATILSAQCTDERVNMVTPEAVRPVPDARGAGRRRPRRARGDHQADRLLPQQGEEPHGDGDGTRRALRQRGAGCDGGPRDRAGRRAARPRTSCEAWRSTCRACPSTRMCCV